MAIPILNNGDLRGPRGQAWMYSDAVKEHFFRPRNLMEDPADLKDFNGFGQVGSPACGDVMKIWINVDVETDRILDLRWQTFGCASAIASTSMMSVMVCENGGMTTSEALSLTPQMIVERLGGLPDRKIHCSVLGDKALAKAVNDYYRGSEQFDRVKVSGAKVVDPDTNITDKDIEEAVLEGARDLESLQAKLKVAIGNPDVLPEVESLLAGFAEKYYG